MNEKMKEILENPLTLQIAVGVASFGLGFASGYFLKKRKEIVLETHEFPTQLEFGFDADTEEEQDLIDTVTAYSDRPPKVVIPEEVVHGTRVVTVDSLSELRPSMVDADAADMDDDSDDVLPVDDTTDEDDSNDLEWDYEEEILKRSSHTPYVLHQEEFYADELNYTQSSLTYYEGDDIMADEEQVPIYNYLNITGPLLFGHGSGDPNVVYIRNDQIKGEYEIVRVDQAYAIEVLGYEVQRAAETADLKHSKHSLKFRDT